MIKLAQYEIFKISTTRLAEANYNISLSYNQAVINNEVVKLGSSQALRKIREYCQYTDEQEFISEYISIHVDKKAHYKHIKRFGLYVNGKKFVRYSCGAGNARNENVFLIREDIYSTINTIMKCGVNNKLKLVKNKYSAYFALTTSSSYVISKDLNVCVIPDYTITFTHKFDYITYVEDLNDCTVERKDVEIKDYPPFDGMGVMSVECAEQIAQDLELDYIPSACIIRNCWIKGCTATMDFKAFAEKFKVHTVKDVWGKEYDIRELDMILTESQFKLWKGYKSWEEYHNKILENNIQWGVARVSPKKDKTHAFTNYQFIQVLDLSDEDVVNICKPTVDWLRDIMGRDVMTSLLYMCGTENQIEYDKISDPATKALILNNRLIEDSYIKTKLTRSINKKIREAYSGKLIVDGNFSFMLSDPFALLQWALGLQVTGLLKEKQYFNGFWNKRDCNRVAAMRSPLTHYSEVNTLNLVNDEETNEWYKYLVDGCTIYNIYGDDTFRHADSDKTIVRLCSDIQK